MVRGIDGTMFLKEADIQNMSQVPKNDHEHFVSSELSFGIDSSSLPLLFPLIIYFLSIVVDPCLVASSGQL